ncbi:DUF1573 domain-containing protein [Chitinophaga sp. S165]|uniref:DUF1573 domain-containing protein n=1 Tax=Chitinophaga sp. S165 TaxID=2135462 RepID=UPI001304C0B9|nr:DUF1573 domain-containing protein [Chitinophaga sp. S165]
MKLADVIKSDSTLVMRLTKRHPDISQHILLSKVSWFTAKYPPTDSIIVLADELPSDSGGGWKGILRTASIKIRVFKIDSSLLPVDLESQQRSYVFYLNKKLQAGGVYVPDSLYGDKTNNYFASAAATMGREQTNPLIEHTKGAARYYGTSNRYTGAYFGSRRVDVGASVVNRAYYEDFTFLNTGREPLVIYKVRNNWSGSGCSVSIPDNSIRPGQRGRIRVYYKPGRKGTFRNEVRVYSNASGSPHTFVITGTAISERGVRTTRY